MKKITSLVMLLCIMTLNVQSVFAQPDSAAASSETDTADAVSTDSNEVITEVVEETP